MVETTVSELAPFGNGHDIDFIEKNGEILFLAEEIGRQLGYSNPAHAIHKLFRNNQNELKHYSVETKTVSTDGKSYATRAFTEEGVYILSMLARTNQAKRFRARVALLLRRIRQEQVEYQATCAHSLGYNQGLSDARALPAAEAERKAMYLEGMKEGQRVQKRKDGLGTLERALAYMAKGLRISDAARLVGVPERTLRHRVQRVRKGVSGVTA